MHTAGMLRLWAMTVFVAFALIGRAHGASAERRVPSFSDLPVGDKIIAVYHAVTCFTYEAAEFVFDGRGHGSFEVHGMRPALFDLTAGNNGIAVVPNQPRSNSGSTQHIARVRLGSIALELGERKKLDATVALYRSPRAQDAIVFDGNFTHLELRHIRNGAVLAEENLDLTGKYAPAASETLTFWDMLRLLNEHSTRAAKPGIKATLPE